MLFAQKIAKNQRASFGKMCRSVKQRITKTCPAKTALKTKDQIKLKSKHKRGKHRESRAVNACMEGRNIEEVISILFKPK